MPLSRHKQKADLLVMVMAVPSFYRVAHTTILKIVNFIRGACILRLSLFMQMHKFECFFF